jgi:hypothetical protein
MRTRASPTNMIEQVGSLMRYLTITVALTAPSTDQRRLLDMLDAAEPRGYPEALIFGMCCLSSSRPPDCRRLS